MWVEGHWFTDPSIRAYCYIQAGDYDPAVTVDPTYTIPVRAIRDLIPVLEADGLLVPRLDERLRTEDLKITHRLLDIIEHKR